MRAYCTKVDAHNAAVSPLTARAVGFDLNRRPEAGAPTPPVRTFEFGGLIAGDARVASRNGRGEVERLVAEALSNHDAEQARARKAAADAAAPPVRMRRFRAANGTIVEAAADKALPYGTQRAVELGDLVEIP